MKNPFDKLSPYWRIQIGLIVVLFIGFGLGMVHGLIKGEKQCNNFIASEYLTRGVLAELGIDTIVFPNGTRVDAIQDRSDIDINNIGEMRIVETET